jgi:preprotein translocase subunit Sec61beta
LRRRTEGAFETIETPRVDATLIRRSKGSLFSSHSWEAMMSRKKKEGSSPMPAASAGLLRFFEEETEGVKIRPEVLMILAVMLVVISILAKVFF